MNYNRPDLLDRLAAEYALGTLSSRARRRFTGLIAGNLVARRAAGDWERKLAPLALDIRAAAPPQRVWQGIAARLGFANALVRPRGTGAAKIWQAIAATIAIVAIGVTTYTLTRPPVVKPMPMKPTYVALFMSTDNKPAWMLSAYMGTNELHASAMQAPKLAANKSYELWMLLKDGSAPISMGLLPAQGEMREPMSAKTRALFASTKALAISLEPKGGSPTGAPTGPVMFVAPLVDTSA